MHPVEVSLPDTARCHDQADGHYCGPGADAPVAPVPEARIVSDAELLRGVGQHDSHALEALYDRHHQVAFGLALRVLRSQHLAEDVVQEAFLAVWRQGATYHAGRGTVRNWLLSIVHHRAVDYLRRRHVAQPPTALDETMPDTERPEVWEQAARNVEWDGVRAAIVALPPAQRRTIELAYFSGLTCQEVATRMHVPVGTVKGRTRLALQKLRLLLAPQRTVEAP